MAKKGAQIQLQVEVNNDDDWAKLLERDGLIVVDVYSDWCGPCSAMSANLKKIKLEIGGDSLQLAMAKCNHITDLARFRDKSEPTWMFIAGKKMVNLVFGANSPKLQATVLNELKKEEAVKEGTRQRDEALITSLSPEEQVRFDEEQRIKKEKADIALAEKQKAKAERLEVIVNAVATVPQQHYGLVLVFPYAKDRLDLLSEIWEQHKQSNSEAVQLKNINLDDLLFYTSYRFPDKDLEQAGDDTCTAYLVKNEDPELDIDEEVLKIVYGDSMGPPGSPDTLAERMLTPYTPAKKEGAEETEDAAIEEIAKEAAKETAQETAKDGAKDAAKDAAKDGAKDAAKDGAKDAAKEGEEGDQEEIKLNGIWVPGDEKTRYLSMFYFFPNVVGPHVPPEPEPTPPHVAIAFDTWKKMEVIAAIEKNPEEIMHMGFFTDEKVDVAKLICKTPAAYARRVANAGEKLILQLSKKKSDVFLTFAQLGPTYMSIDAEVGADECKKFFPEDYDDDVAGEVSGKKKEGDDTVSEGEGFVEGMAAGDDIEGGEDVEEEGSEEEEEEEEEGEEYGSEGSEFKEGEASGVPAPPPAAPEAPPETKPEAAPEAKPEAAPETKPEASPEAAPEAKPEAAPPTAPAEAK